MSIVVHEGMARVWPSGSSGYGTSLVPSYISGQEITQVDPTSHWAAVTPGKIKVPLSNTFFTPVRLGGISQILR
jgi:hypothetical protein